MPQRQIGTAPLPTCSSPVLKHGLTPPRLISDGAEADPMLGVHMMDETTKHRNPRPTTDDLRMHRQGVDAILDGSMAEIKLVAPGTEYDLSGAQSGKERPVDKG